MKIKSGWLVAVLGVLVGVLAFETIEAYRARKSLMTVQYKDWRKLNLILQQVDLNYVDEVDKQKVTDAAVQGALSALDPHSVYMPPVERTESEESLDGGFDGIGIQFNVPNDTAIVLEAIPGGPSEKIGIRAGDRIIKVDDKVIAGVKFPQDSMVRRMKGPAGTKVLVTIMRDGELVPFNITRGKIPTHSVDAAFMLSDTLGYIRLSKFARTTYSEVRDASGKLLGQGMKHLVMDLRDNSGGYFDQAIHISNMFLPKDSLIVYMEGRARKREDFRADGHGKLLKVGLTVLISENTASSSEIFAGAMQDNGRGRIVGRRSFGKGLVQEPINLSDGSGVRLTVARFYTPSGRCIQKPYTDDYNYEIYKRYGTGEMTAADSMDAAKGGIIPDTFVPVDTTKASPFYIACNRKATPMRFASAYFDTHREELGSIGEYGALLRYLDGADLEKKFLAFALEHDGLKPASESDFTDMRDYLMTSVRALIGRYSRLGDNAFYHLYLSIDPAMKFIP